MFVETTDFELPPYQLPSLVDLQTTFDAYVDAEEEKILIELLGRKLYTDFIAGLAEVAPLQKWTDLAIGKEYTYNGKKYKWLGMDKLLIPYIYRQWTKDNVIDTLTSGGVTIPKMENADLVSPSRKLVKAQNDFAIVAGHDRCEVFDTLYGFLRESGDTYLTSSVTDAGYTDIKTYLDDHFKFPGLSNVFNI